MWLKDCLADLKELLFRVIHEEPLQFKMVGRHEGRYKLDGEYPDDISFKYPLLYEMGYDKYVRENTPFGTMTMINSLGTGLCHFVCEKKLTTHCILTRQRCINAYYLKNAKCDYDKHIVYATIRPRILKPEAVSYDDELHRKFIEKFKGRRRQILRVRITRFVNRWASKLNPLTKLSGLWRDYWNEDRFLYWYERKEIRNRLSVLITILMELFYLVCLLILLIMSETISPVLAQEIFLMLTIDLSWMPNPGLFFVLYCNFALNLFGCFICFCLIDNIFQMIFDIRKTRRACRLQKAVDRWYDEKNNVLLLSRKQRPLYKD